MIAEIGHALLILSMGVALLQSLSPWIGRADAALVSRASALLALLLASSFVCLLFLFATTDLSVKVVVQNSHSLKPMIYKIAAAWGHHEGSMLLWVLMLALWGGVYAWRSRGEIPAFRLWTLTTQGMIALGFTAFVLLTSNPFARVSIPPRDGMGLNPLLQDVSLALHPPLLYAGYVGFSLTFSLAVAALMTGRVDAAFARVVRPWVLSAWVFLTAGIALGSFWAYYELGWGGFWFWDPVENASLLPWLAGTALLHSVVVLEKRGSLKNWTLFLSIIAFTLSLLGTFLVRSGVLTSVHAFASDPARGVFILGLLTLAIGAAFTLYAIKGPDVASGLPVRPVSREGSLLLNNIFLFTFTATVLVGTLYPVILTGLNLGEVAVGAPYYNAFVLPVLLPFSLLMALGPQLAWRRDQLSSSLSRLYFSIGAAFVAAVIFADQVVLAIGVSSSVLILSATLSDLFRRARLANGWKRLPRRQFGMAVAHAGFALLILGATFATQKAIEKTIWMQAGDTLSIAGREVSFVGADMALGPNYTADRAILTVDGGHVLVPEKRWYPVAGTTTSETAMLRDGLGIFYAVLGDADAENPGRFVVRLYDHPLLLLVYIGALLMILGGALSWKGRAA